MRRRCVRIFLYRSEHCPQGEREVERFVNHYLGGLSFSLFKNVDRTILATLGDPRDCWLFCFDDRTTLDGDWKRLESVVPHNHVHDLRWWQIPNVESRITEISAQWRGRKLTAQEALNTRRRLLNLRHLKRPIRLVGTGPSADAVYDVEIENALTIVCNTVISNRQMMAELEPEILAFSDPAFHLGFTPYAEKFRAELDLTLNEHPNLDVWTLRKHHRFLQFLFPQHSSRFFSAESSGADGDINLDLYADLAVKPFPNILTLLMLPLAATLSQELHLFGFTGRKPGSEFFWDHNPDVQLSHLLTNHRERTAGFHSIDFDRYFSTHCSTVEEMISKIEGQGGLVKVHGESFIPALSFRSQGKQATHNLSTSRTRNTSAGIVVIAPNWQGPWGHYEPWNETLFEEAMSRGIGFSAWANLERTSPERDHVIPGLGDQSPTGWKYLTRQDLRRLSSYYSGGSEEAPNTFFCYEGRESDVRVWLDLAKSLPMHKFVLNLMVLDLGGGYLRGLARRLKKIPNLVLTADHEAMQARILSTGCSVRLFPFFAPNGFIERIPLMRPSGDIPSLGIFMHLSKGVEVLRSGIKQISTMVSQGKLVVRGFIDVRGYSPPNCEGILNLAQMIGDSLPDVQIVDQNLPLKMGRAEFRDALSSCDVVLIPHDNDGRTSGLAVDALCAGCQLLVVKTNWIRTFGLPDYSALEFGEDASFGECLDALEQFVELGNRSSISAFGRSRFRVDRAIDFLVHV